MACRASGVLGHGGHTVGMVEHASNANNVTASGPTGSPTDHYTNDQAVSLHQALQGSRRELIALNFNQPVAALYQVLALVGLWGPSCGAPNYWPISPAQFETNHPQPR